MQGTVDKALHLISLYESAGYSKDRILIKIASTWEGLQAAKILENTHGIHCNMTLLFGFVQAVTAAQFGVTLISPFVGRILDWYKKNFPNSTYEARPEKSLASGSKTGSDAAQDPGVTSVTRIYQYYKKYNYPTMIMGASFRNIDQIKSLIGCDCLTISPTLLKQLEAETGQDWQVALSVKDVQEQELDDAKMDMVTEAQFRWALNEDPMANDKLAEGIRLFARDTLLLEDFLAAHF